MREFKVQAAIAFVTWATWWALLGLEGFAIIKENFAITLTMLLGSFVAGSTSVGGGAVSFPIFTKVLHIDSTSALIFSLAIQSVGMSAASIMIFLTKIPICWRIVLTSIVAGGSGLVTSFFLIGPHIAGTDVKIVFSCFSFLVAMGLVWTRLNDKKLSLSDELEPGVASLIVCCFVGGMLSGIIGTGIDFFVFSMMIFCWRFDFKKAIATSVVVMAFNSLVGFGVILMTTDYFTGNVVGYWLSAVPIVVIGAPLGAIACKYIHKDIMISFLLLMILLDVLSTILIIDAALRYLLMTLLLIPIFAYYNSRQTTL